MEAAVEAKSEPTNPVRYRIQSVCECQGILEAELDDHHNVLAGWVRPVRSRCGAREVAPANAVAPELDRFDVVWQCPLCGRNTLRTFYVGALQRAS